MKSGDKFEASYKGARYRFVAAEHVNIGEGWWCRELDSRLPLRECIVHSSDLEDIVSEQAA